MLCFSFSIVKHLTTLFDWKDAMITVDDGIRKLEIVFDAKGKVWTQDMILQVDEKAVSLIGQNQRQVWKNIYLFYFQSLKIFMSTLGSDCLEHG